MELVLIGGALVLGWVLGYYNIPSIKLNTQDALDDLRSDQEGEAPIPDERYVRPHTASKYTPDPGALEDHG